MYEEYCSLGADGKWIGLENGAENSAYFCTPVNAWIIGWENSIHYCFIEGYRDMVFAVNPETCTDRYVYPLAMNFKDFLRLILACGSTTAAEQIICWSKQQFEHFLISEDNAVLPEQQYVLNMIKEKLKLTPLENPYEYVKAVQDQYKNAVFEFSNEYYDTLGLERPDGTESGQKLFEFEPIVFRFEKKDEK